MPAPAACSRRRVRGAYSPVYDLHRTEMAGAHRAGNADLVRILGQGAVVLGRVRDSAEVEWYSNGTRIVLRQRVSRLRAGGPLPDRRHDGDPYPSALRAHRLVRNRMSSGPHSKASRAEQRSRRADRAVSGRSGRDVVVEGPSVSNGFAKTAVASMFSLIRCIGTWPGPSIRVCTSGSAIFVSCPAFPVSALRGVVASRLSPAQAMPAEGTSSAFMISQCFEMRSGNFLVVRRHHFARRTARETMPVPLGQRQ